MCTEVQGSSTSGIGVAGGASIGKALENFTAKGTGIIEVMVNVK